MTASEWETTGDLDAMLTAIKKRASDRKMLLFACGCCRLVDGQLPGVGGLAARFEKDADRPMGRDEKFSLLSAVFQLASGEPQQILTWLLGGTDQSPWLLASRVAGLLRNFQNARRASADPFVDHWAEQAAVLRELLGNPFRRPAFDAEWRTDTAVGVATAVEADAAWDRMPILADALQDAGCEDAAVLAHCRDPRAAHRRGCWVLDEVLGRP
jgi:hypothetical protein